MNPTPAQTDLPKPQPTLSHADTPPPNELKRNLQALGEVDPALAERLDRLQLADHFIPARGRDASPTLKRKHPDGTTSWLGRTSMPTISAPALLDGFDHRGGNIAFHGIGQGLEAALLTARMEPRQTLFVLEPDPLAVAGAFTLHDLSAAIRTRQIVLLAGKDAFDQLLRFLLDNPGFDPPERFLQWPWHPPAEIARFKSALEDLHRALADRRCASLDHLTSRVLHLEPPSAKTDITRCLVVSRRYDRTAAAVTEDLVAAGRSIGWSISRVDWHHPGQTSTLALLGEIDRLGPHFVLLLNELRGQLGDSLPPAIPVVSWFLEPRHTVPLRDARLGPPDLVLAESPTTAHRLIKAGISPESITVLPPGAGSPTDDQPPDQPAQPRGQDWDVACFADAADLSAQARGIELSALAAIYQAMVDALARQADRADTANLEQLLDRLAKRARLRVTDPQVRQDLLGHLEFDAAETILARHYLRALLKAGIRVRLWGQGWEAEPSLRHAWAGPRPEPHEVQRLLAQSPLVLDCCLRERLSRGTLAAALAGALPLVRGRFPSPPGPGRTAVAWPENCCPTHIGFPTYMEADRLLKDVRELLSDMDRRAALADTLRANVLAHHLAAHRLKTIARLAAERTGQQPPRQPLRQPPNPSPPGP